MHLKRQNNKVLILRYITSHHAKKSGYDQVFDFILKIAKKELILDSIILKQRNGFRIEIINAFLYQVYKRFNIVKYWHINVVDIFKAKILLLLKKPDLIHLTYFEDHIKFINGNKSHKIIATIHQPFAKFIQHNELISGLKLIDFAIFLTPEQMNKFSKIYELKSCVIPHPIDFNFYNFIHEQKKSNILKILYISGHLRNDQDLLSLLKLVKNFKIIEVIVVTNKKDLIKSLRLLKHNGRIKIYSNIDDETLLKIYRESHFIFLPFEEFTASNTLLESLATGLIPIVKDIEGISFYTDNIKIIKYKILSKLILENCIELFSNENMFFEIINHNRSIALKKFSLEIVGEKIKKLYIELLKDDSNIN